MNHIAADRNLLTGILGMQTGLFSESQLIAAMQAWVFQKTSSIEEILVAQNVLDTQRKQFLIELVERYLAVNGSSAAQALTMLPAKQDLTENLKLLNDDEVSSCITVLESLGQQIQPTIKENDEPALDLATVRFSDDRYRVLRLKAQGGLGLVSIAEDLQLHREVALKQIKPEFANNPDSRSRFLIEAEVTGRLEHPGIVPVYSLGSTSAGPYYAMQLIRGKSLSEAVEELQKQVGSLPVHEYHLAVRRLVKRLVDVGNALSYAHSRGVLHRDVKPSNIMLGKFGETLLVDWGLAKTGASRTQMASKDEPTFVPRSGDSTETRMGSVVGTLAYMSPEQANGRQDLLGPSTDIYSLGATLYCVLTGHAPFEKSYTQENLQKVRSGNFVEPIIKNDRVPKALNAICKKAMATRIEDRYGWIVEMLEDLELFLADEPVSVYQEPFLERALRSAKRHRTGLAIATTLLASLMVGLFVLNLISRKQNAELKLARDEANKARRLAEENSDTAQQLSMVLLKNAEKKLSDRAFVTNPITRQLRSELTEAAVETFQKILPQAPPSKTVLADFAEVLRTSANLKRLSREFETAAARLRQSVEIQEGISAQERTPEQNDYLAETYRDLSILRKAEGKLTDAEQLLDASDKLAEQAIVVDPSDVRWLRTIARNKLERIALRDSLGKTDDALSLSQDCTNRFRLIYDAEKKLEDLYLLLLSSSRQIQLLGKLKRFDEAETFAKQTIDFASPLATKYADDGNIIVPYCRILYWSAENLIDKKDANELSEQRLTQAAQLIGALAPKTSLATHLNCLVDTQLVVAKFKRVNQRIAEAESAIALANTTIDKLIKSQSSPANSATLAEVLVERARIQLAQSNPQAAIEYLQQAKTRQQEACTESAENVLLRSGLQAIERELELLLSAGQEPAK